MDGWGRDDRGAARAGQRRCGTGPARAVSDDRIPAGDWPGGLADFDLRGAHRLGDGGAVRDAVVVFALRASEEEWAKFWSSRPPPGSHDLMALIKRRVLKAEGNLQVFMANLRYFKEALAKLRAAGARGMSAKFEPITGRYMHLDLFGRPHRHLCRGSGRGYAAAVPAHRRRRRPPIPRADERSARHARTIASSPSTCPGTANRRRHRAGTTRSTNSPRRNTRP